MKTTITKWREREERWKENEKKCLKCFLVFKINLIA